MNAELVESEDLGIAEGVSGERFHLQRGPVVPGDEPAVLEVSTQAGWEEWSEVADFAGSGPDDKHFVIDLSSGELRLGPAVRLEDGVDPPVRRGPGARAPDSGCARTASAAVATATSPPGRCRS